MNIYSVWCKLTIVVRQRIFLFWFTLQFILTSKIHYPIWEITKVAKFSKKQGQSPLKSFKSPKRKSKFSQSMDKRHTLIQTIWNKIKNQYKKRTRTKNFLNSEVGSVLSVAGLAQAVIAWLDFPFYCFFPLVSLWLIFSYEIYCSSGSIKDKTISTNFDSL
jgi:hypothetical protein